MGRLKYLLVSHSSSVGVVAEPETSTSLVSNLQLISSAIIMLCVIDISILFILRKYLVSRIWIFEHWIFNFSNPRRVVAGIWDTSVWSIDNFLIIHCLPNIIIFKIDELACSVTRLKRDRRSMQITSAPDMTSSLTLPIISVFRCRTFTSGAM